MLKKATSDSYRLLLAPATSITRTEIERITTIINDHPFPNHPIQPTLAKHVPLSSLSPPSSPKSSAVSSPLTPTASKLSSSSSTPSKPPNHLPRRPTPSRKRSTF
ncbi:hypothetical protein Bca52824_078102 [Brassica carinata]|uniref:Uncharacterized protein n=1 Tax=Brassica carinata TaxID=52824 RepID=A0A8X7PX13_BRACI|nr:hypothetical protein Bca52824_078102 [Brassica carinata]